ncbi:MAG TPA: trigger factor [Thermoanaerobaculia bacterium]|nr:trigger factor [Thermoanaerobaculia bacterium]
MSVVVSMQEVGPCRKQLTVEVPAPVVAEETERVVKEYGRRVRIPGFRRGKVPSEMVRRRFAKDIEKEVVDRLLPRYWREAQAESGIAPLLPPEVDEIKDLEPGAPLTFVATVETRPQIELRNIRDFDLPDPSTDPGTLDLEQALEELRARFGTWVPAERPAARGDLVTAQITPADAPEGPPPREAPAVEAAAAAASGQPSDHQAGDLAADQARAGTRAPDEARAGTRAPDNEPIQFEVGDERVWEELSLAVSGLAAGQEARFSRQEDGAAGGAAGPGGPAGAAGAVGSAGSEKRLRVRVIGVKERELPPLDDELAARVNPHFSSVEELREAVARRLRESRIEERRELRERALLDQLRERHPLELPRGVVERERENLLADYADSLARRGVKVEQAGIDWSQMREQMQPLAERRVHARLLLDAIAEAEPVVLSDEEFERALAALARAQNTSTPALRRTLDEKDRLGPLRDQLRRDKTLRHLLGEEPEEAPPPPSSAPLPDAAPGAPPSPPPAQDSAAAGPNTER